MNITLYGLIFELTHDACPESYVVYDDGKQIATVTYHWGVMTCRKDGKDVYTRHAEYDWLSRFRNDKERTEWLEDAARHIKAS